MRARSFILPEIIRYYSVTDSTPSAPPGTAIISGASTALENVSRVDPRYKGVYPDENTNLYTIQSVTTSTKNNMSRPVSVRYQPHDFLPSSSRSIEATTTASRTTAPTTIPISLRYNLYLEVEVLISKAKLFPGIIMLL